MLLEIINFYEYFDVKMNNFYR